ncbi:hypothetical protein F5146DRAFT_1156412 [Armillaria mellea]|nr:hypothetical protein F5146DRAFT_1156412 [Armillaria mellea]
MNHGGVVTKILYGCSADVELIFGVPFFCPYHACSDLEHCLDLLEVEFCCEATYLVPESRTLCRAASRKGLSTPVDEVVTCCIILNTSFNRILATYTKLTLNFAPRRCIAFRGAKCCIDQEEGGWASIKREGSVHEVFIFLLYWIPHNLKHLSRALHLGRPLEPQFCAETAYRVLAVDESRTRLGNVGTKNEHLCGHRYDLAYVGMGHFRL